MSLSICRSIMPGMFVVLFVLYAPAQTERKDSIKSALESATSNKVKVQLLCKLAEEISSENLDEALAIFDEAISKAKASHDQYLLSSCYNALGKLWYKNNDIQQSTKYYFMALDGFENNEAHASLIGELHSNIGSNFQKQEDFSRSLDYFERGLSFLKNSNDKKQLALLYNNLGLTYKQLNRLDDALEMYKLSLQINREINNVTQQLYNINNIGVIYINKGRYELASEYFKEALKINYERNDFVEVSKNLLNLGTVLRHLGNNDQALDTLDHAYSLAKSYHDSDLKYRILAELYEASLEKQEYKKALDYFQEYKSVEDSLYKTDQYTSLVELEAKYKVSQNERAIQLSQTQLLNQRLINAVILAALVLAIFLIVFLAWIFLLNKKNEKQLIELNQEIDAQNEKIQAINHNLERTIEQRTKTIQDQNTRLKDFAHMNSHRVRRPLSSILGIVNLLQEENNSEKKQELIDMLEGASKEMDDIIFEINQNLQEEKL